MNVNKILTKIIIMKISTKLLAAVLLSTVIFSSCEKFDKKIDKPERVSPESFTDKIVKAMEGKTQKFSVNVDQGQASFTSESGVEVSFGTSCLKKNGNPVTGDIDIEFIEVFDKGSMLITNKPTMGVMENGKKSLLISGGEFSISVTQDDVKIDNECGVHMKIPTDLTGDPDHEMKIFRDGVDDNCDGLACPVDWVKDDKAELNVRKGEGDGEGQGSSTSYYAYFSGFGWTNVDKFYSDPRPKTTILVSVPENFDNTNCAVYLSYDGEPTALASLDRYTTEGLFTEHYGQIPIGLECHVIFATADGDDWRYAIKAVTIAENDIININMNDTHVATENEITVLINNLP